MGGSINTILLVNNGATDLKGEMAMILGFLSRPEGQKRTRMSDFGRDQQEIEKVPKRNWLEKVMSRHDRHQLNSGEWRLYL